jgi:hypothetical protein
MVVLFQKIVKLKTSEPLHSAMGKDNVAYGLPVLSIYILLFKTVV